MTETVSASALTLHLDCSRTYSGKLEAEGVIQRQGDGFPLIRAVLPTCDACGASGGSPHAVRPTLITSGPRPRCCNCDRWRRCANWCAGRMSMR